MNQEKAKEFIVVAYKDILGDIRKGEGQYLSSLLHLLKIQDDQKDPSIKKIHALSEAYPDISEFADRVVDAFIK